jgi:PKD domain
MVINAALFVMPAILLILLLLSSSSFSSPSVTMAQQTGGATTLTPLPPTTTPSLTPTPPLTPEEQEQQIRLQNVIASTTQNLQETEKQANGIVFTPRWSNPVWINPNSVSVLIAYCLPGEFADSGQEILGGFELEVLESYAIALPQGFMAWMAVVGNEDDVQNRRFPAALGVICASDINRADTRILSPQEQQQINNINQQFVNIQNTQITDIDNVINIINNVTANDTTTEPVTPPSPPTDDTGGGTREPLTVEIIPNATEAVVPAWFVFTPKITGGTEPYTYDWQYSGIASPYPYEVLYLWVYEAGTYNVILTVTDSKYQTDSEGVQITAREPTQTLCRLGTFFNSTSGRCESLFPDVIGNATIVPRDTTPPPTLIALIKEPIESTNGDTAPATFLFEANAEGGVPPYTYSWDFGDGSPQSNEISIHHTYEQAGLYDVTLRVTDSTGLTATSIGSVNVRPATTPEPEPEPTPEPTPTPEPQPEPEPEPEPTPEPEPEPEPSPQEGEQGQEVAEQ